MKKYAIGIDIGGGSTVVGLVDENGTLVDSNKENTIKTDAIKYKDIDLFMDDVASAILKLKEVAEKDGNGIVIGVGIGAPNASYMTGTIENAPNLQQAWKNRSLNIVKMTESRVKIPVYLDNDANCAAIGEWKYGKGKGMNNFIQITLGTGLGGGVFSEGKLVRGSHGLAGELGHMIIRRSEGRKCGCGRYGCLETYASAKGVARTAVEFLEVYKNPDSELYTTYRTRKEKGLTELYKEKYKEDMLVNSRDVAVAASNGDEVALEIFEYTGKILGEALADYAAFSDPDKIFIFGGLANAGELILNPVRKHFNANLLNVFANKGIEIEVSALNSNSDAAVLGASALPWEKA